MVTLSLQDIYHFEARRKIEGFTSSGLPVIVIDGIEKGKILLITGGVHGGEYASIKALQELAKWIQPERITGKIILLPIVNQSAFFARLAYLTPEDQKNLNRSFLNPKSGTFTENLAHRLDQDFLSRCDYYIDCHGGDLPEKLLPHVYYSHLYTDKQAAIMATQMADWVDVPIKIFSQADGGVYQRAAKRNIPSLLLERGDFGQVEEVDVDLYVKDLVNLLRGLNFLSEHVVSYGPKLVREAAYLYAEHTSCWQYEVTIGQQVQMGQVIGKQLDIFGNMIADIKAPLTGTVLYHMASYAVSEGDLLFALVAVD